MVVRKFRIVERGTPFIRFCNRDHQRFLSFSNGKEGLAIELTSHEAYAIQKAFAEGYVDFRGMAQK